MLGGILGEEDEKPDVEASATLAGTEAFAAAVAARLSASDPEVARDTSTFLKRQARLLEIQAEHLNEEHSARLHFLQGQAREVDIRRFGLRLRVGFQLFVALVATAFGIGLAVLIWDATTSRRVVVDAFHTVPSAQTRGIDGVALASGLLDELNRLQEATRTDIRKLDLSTAWAAQVKMEIPTTGISVGEISQWLRERFGHDVHIDGELTESPALGRSAQGLGRPARAAGQGEVRACQIRRGAAVRAELEATQGRARSVVEAEDLGAPLRS